MISCSDSVLSPLVLLGLGEAKLSVLEQILRALAEQCGGFGATLWQLRGADGTLSADIGLEHLRQHPSLGQLYVLAHGFDETSYRCMYHDLPLTKATGQAVLWGEFEVADAATHPLVDHESAFARQANPGSICALRVTFPDGSIGAITLYRRQKGQLDPSIRARFAFLARHIPALYASVRDRVSYSLVDRVSVALAEAESVSATDPQNSALNDVCSIISDSLGCLETSVFLRDRRAQEGTFPLAATSQPSLIRTSTYNISDDGITPYVLRSGNPVYILDTASIPASLRQETGWEPRPGLEEEVRNLAGLQPDDASPPFSFAAVPMLGEGKVIGVLRCSICPKAPYFLAEREIELMTILASRMSGYWKRKLRLEGIQDAERSWATFVNGLSELTQQTQAVSEKYKSKRSTDALRESIFQKALMVLETSILGADTLEVALIDGDGRTISPRAVRGDDWHAFPGKGVIKDPMAARLLHPPLNNSWAYVCDQKRLEFIEDTSKAQIPYAGVLPQTRQALFAPILVDNRCVGILGIRSHSTIRDPERAKSMAMLAALVIALYHQLTTILNQQLQTYQHLEHQLRSPIFQAYKRIKLVVQEETRDPTEQLLDRMYDLNAVNGLLSKAQRVLGNIRLYEQLAMEQPITPKRVATPLSELVRLIKEAAADNRLLWTHKNMKFRVDVPSFERLKMREITLDITLFEQVISNLLDNAGKYGDRGSYVHIDGSQDNEKRLEINVRSKGIVLSADDLPQLGIRGFRSEAAKRRSTEGIGSGLYLVHHIMTAQGGCFVPHATEPHGVTTMTVAFPTGK